MTKSYDHVRAQILGKEKISSHNEVISIVTAEECRRGVILEPDCINSSALISRDSKPRKQTNEVSHCENSTPETDSRDNLWCTFCKKPRHIKEKY